MKEVFGKNKAGGIQRNNGVKMIVSIIAVTLFIGAAMQAAIAGSISSIDHEPVAVEEECLPCKSIGPKNENPKCETCVQAVFHAVKYMRGHVKTSLKDKGVYFLRTVDVSILVVEGLVLGVKDSGFKIKIDYNDLNNTINSWVKKLVGPQLFFITRFMARLGAISIGIIWYLLSFCY
ncbi:MAG: hypothetical protein JSW60_09395 [Thermoplasmatales archaeon]|nr:MAG: hypothetical protein JSW60_09395 [Thermoplasmatales archaeon]